jgi:hypothetical protein
MDHPGKRMFSLDPTLRDGASRHARSAQSAPTSGDQGRIEDRLARIRTERDELRIVLQKVLDLGVFDGAGRSVTVQTLLRGYLATKVRMVLGTKRET